MMQPQELKPFALGRQSFDALRLDDAVYVDKTDLIFDLVTQWSRRVILTRPHRFGKSLLLNTLKSLFKFGLRNFKGLKIEKYWTEKTYTVLHFDFSILQYFKTIEEFKQQFCSQVRSVISEYGQFIDSDDPDHLISAFLKGCESQSVVILIDEFDAPLTRHLGDPELYGQVERTLESFYCHINSHDEYLRFVFLTGIVKLGYTSIFSAAFQEFIDVSRYEEFGTLIGFTEEEIKDYFGAHIEQAAITYHRAPEDILEEIRFLYDGYTFDRSFKTKVYCPWDILNYLDDLSPKPHWFNSGGFPYELFDLFGSLAFDPLEFNNEKWVSTLYYGRFNHYDELEVNHLLAQTGYLIPVAYMDSDVILDFPNRLVKREMAFPYAKPLVKEYPPRNALALYPQPVFQQKDLALVVEGINLILEQIDHEHYPLADDYRCCAYLQLYFLGINGFSAVDFEVNKLFGHLTIEIEEVCWSFAIKVVNNSAEACEAMRALIENITNEQMIEVSTKKDVMKVAMVYSAQERRFVAWEEIRHARRKIDAKLAINIAKVNATSVAQ